MLTRSDFIKLALAASVIPSYSQEKESNSSRKLILIAGPPSHPKMMHEFRAGTILLEKRLKAVPNLVVDRHEMGWVDDEVTFKDADAIVLFSDGLKRHPVMSKKEHVDTMKKIVSSGVGFGCMHYAVEVKKNQVKEASGRKEAVMWAIERPDGGRGFGFTGGHFHQNWTNDSFRKLILNALCWVSKVDIPDTGILSDPVSNEEIIENLDEK